MNKTAKPDIIRIIDANLNRSREGLRVCEDIARFTLSSASLTRDLKEVRHAISDIAKKKPLGPGVLSESRDSEKDIGRCSKTAGEMSRDRIADIFSANIERVKESLRVLEEFFKLIDKRSSAKFASLRFRTYDIEKRAVKKLAS